jgi:hypothetical protein
MPALERERIMVAKTKQGIDHYQVMIGGALDDLIEGMDGDDFIFGRDGNDMLIDGDGNDYVRGGKGDDFFSNSIGNDTLLGNAGNDTFQLFDLFWIAPRRVEIDGGKGYDVVNLIADPQALEIEFLGKREFLIRSEEFDVEIHIEHVEKLTFNADIV